MDNNKFFVAVASSDGIVVNNHFGRARNFYIYEIEIGNATEIRLVEKRTVEPVCEGGNHDDEKLRKNLMKLADCKYLVVSRIGDGASFAASSMGITPMELPGEIQVSLNQLIKYIQIQNLFS
ncbi:NifB/NifX family molybdenum-iron cluster-binding protein [[Clostridium] polysaccharolyticum]|uniref:Predicted Fe-Mo cluster-binding protein, NifX family n=1 Tax=[Clostridium] polysaccharolyticum TaxID=29364 RepID=A0A1I0AAH1_9FIRM|nr:NifB/NifX family molybdenum-iron cluster-binding protein [[Clostridium] polysaccharolyticum]SES91017.1 Predicted Fe-Mo cluster-binding protein, NifX family [[Clostridium] polysaccharolyticum]